MKRKNSYWKGIPEELKLMCIAEIRGSEHYCTRSIIRYLLDNMNRCDSIINCVTPYDIIRWIDTAFETCLFPLEHYEDIWIECAKDIEQILHRSDELIKRMAPDDYKAGYRVPYDVRHEHDIIPYAQRLEVYFSVLYMYEEKWDELEEHLNYLLSYTEQNVRCMLSCKDAEIFASMEDWAEDHYIGIESWEPINWLCKEFIPAGNALRILAITYEEYVAYLEKMDIFRGGEAALEHLKTNAERRLRALCDAILDEIDDCVD